MTQDLRDTVMALAAGASLEMSPRERGHIERAEAFLAPGTEIFVSAPPAVNHQDIVLSAVTLRRHGFEPVPHIAARSLPGFTQLNDMLARLAGEAGVHHALVIGGDRDPPSGPFKASFDVLALGLFEKHGFSRIGLAAYPEGHTRIGQPILEAALSAKLALLRQAGIEAHLVSQFAFDPAPILGWLRAFRAREPALPVRIGLAGPARITTLARYAVRCGIGASLAALVHHHTSIARLVTEAGPEPVVRALAAEDGAALGLDGIHLFGFGGLVHTARWLAAVAHGDIRLGADELGFSVEDSKRS